MGTQTRTDVSHQMGQPVSEVTAELTSSPDVEVSIEEMSRSSQHGTEMTCSGVSMTDDSYNVLELRHPCFLSSPLFLSPRNEAQRSSCQQENRSTVPSSTAPNHLLQYSTQKTLTSPDLRPRFLSPPALPFLSK